MIRLELLEANARPIYPDRKPTRCQTDGVTRKHVLPHNAAFDEALWAAYRRSDKKGVTEKLFRRSLVRLARRKNLVFAATKNNHKKNARANNRHSWSSEN